MLKTLRKHHLIKALQLCTLKNEYKKQEVDGVVQMNRVYPCLYTGQYCLYVLCRPYGAKTIGVSLYPPLTQWATVVTPRWGVFILPHNKIL